MPWGHMLERGLRGGYRVFVWFGLHGNVREGSLPAGTVVVVVVCVQVVAHLVGGIFHVGRGFAAALV